MLASGDRSKRLAAALSTACLAVLIAACGRGAGTTTDTQPAGAAPSRQPAATSESVNLIDLTAPDLGLIGLGTGAQGNGSARLVVSLDNGRSFSAIGPATAAGTATDDAFFLNREDGWFAVFNTGTSAETLYRTTNGGRVWHSSGAPEHVQAAGSQDTVQFVSAERGWLLSVQPTGPLELLAMTADGGATWQVVASLHPSGGEGLLPVLGLVQFTSTMTGWLGGGQYGKALYRTSDGGRTWQYVKVPAPAGSVFGLPSIFGTTLVEPVTTGTSLALYRSTDGGTHWSELSALTDADAGAGCSTGPLSVSLPTAQVGWLATVRMRHTVVYRTTDGGLHWIRIGTSWAVPADSCEAPVIQATDALHAWLLTAGTSRVYATGNGGATWTRIDPAALAAGG